MNRWMIAMAALLLLLLLAWIGVPDAPRADPERPAATTPPSPPTETEAPAPPLPDAPPVDAELTATDPEPEPVPDLGVGREGQVPVELLGEGDANLQLWLLDAATKAPVAREVTLWRLGVPEGDGWSGGDQIQAFQHVPVGGAIFSDLPPGRYRVQCDGQRKGAPDPAAFSIEAGENVRQIGILLARSFRARLRVFELDGNEIREGILETGRSGECLERTPWAPKWAKPRQPLKGRGYSFSGGHSDGFVTTWDPRPSQLAGDFGFDLGVHEESTRLGSRSKSHRLRLEGCCEVSAGVSSDLGRDVTLCGLAMPLTTILEGVRWPLEVEDARSRAEITAKCFPEIHEKGDPFATAKRSSFYVYIRLPGYRSLSYRWKLGATPEIPEFRPER